MVTMVLVDPVAAFESFDFFKTFGKPVFFPKKILSVLFDTFHAAWDTQ